MKGLIAVIWLLTLVITLMSCRIHSLLDQVDQLEYNLKNAQARIQQYQAILKFNKIAEFPME